MILKNIESILQSVISQDEIIEFIKKVVAIPSYSGWENQETNVAKAFYDLFKSEGIHAELEHVVDGRYNVIGRLKGKQKGKNLLLTGHTDTVPPYDMEDALNLKVKGNKLIGRGAVDMKGPLACMAFSLIALKRAKVELDGDLVFAGVIDEEEGSAGTISLIESNLKVDAAIVGEPTDFHINVAHKGLEWFELFFQGKTVHGGSQKDGINAIDMAARFMQRVNEKLLPEIEREVFKIEGTDEVIYSSMNYGTIKGGTQPSTVAGECTVTLDRRWVPGITYQEVVKGYQDVIDELSKEDDKFKCTLKVMEPSVMKEGYVHEALSTDINESIVSITRKVTEEIIKKKPEYTYFKAWTDGGLISRYMNIPTIVFAPGHIKTAHSAEEEFEMDEILPATLIYASIAAEFCNQ